ncbi:fam-g protein [Plasmodium gallinaceum]|uniref:Fam-g protein n=1 Tax=Plasmodium gallinaceum TaxID=5849 RepID=A0A1J1GZG0_PLAGA|nr:fam-g protein [Plasmodium gallinaceum]CRG97990.1 fam-g protein [Plasmodium gallinaceum]
MKTLTLYLKITTFLLFIWIYQCFFKCDPYKSLIDKNTLKTKNELKYERVLTEGNISGKEQTYAKECIEESPLDDKKNKWENPNLYKDPYKYWYSVITTKLWERFDKETSGMSPNSKNRKWNVEWHKISTEKAKELYFVNLRRYIPYEEKKKIIDSVIEELDSKFETFLCECKKGDRKQ